MTPEQTHGRHLRANWREFGILFLLAVIWSMSFLFIKIGVETIPPMTLTLWRLVLGAVVLCGVAFVTRDGLPREAHVWGVGLFVGLMGNALPNTLIHWGEIRVDSGLTAILMGIMPVAVAVLAHFLTTDERLNPPRVAGVLIGFTGLIILVGWEALRGLGGDAMAQTAILCGALCYAVTTVFIRRFGRRSGRDMAVAAVVCGALFMLPTALLVESPDYAGFSTRSMLAVTVLGIFPTAVATLLYFRLLRTVGATVFSQVNYLIPMLGVLWGVVLLNEQPGWREAFALMCVLSGITLVNLRPR